MKKKIRFKRGISLITLVITIVVIIILAASVILTLGSNNPIEKAKEARRLSDKAQMEEKMNILKAQLILKNGLEGGKTLGEMLVEDGTISQDELENGGLINEDEDIIFISDASGLRKLSENVNNGIDYSKKSIYLINNIDLGCTFDETTGELLSGEEFVPIGGRDVTASTEFSQESYKKAFNGEFDGNSYKITNLYINRNQDGKLCSGLFGYVYKDGVVSNVTIEDSYISGFYDTGSIVGINVGKIKNCINKATVNANKLTGGIAGRSTGTIEDCINYGNINTTSGQTGGIVGNIGNVNSNPPIVSGCENYGKIISSSNYVGGIVGGAWDSTCKIYNCENYGDVGEEKENYENVGGILGVTYGEIQNCINNGTISGKNNVGGICGITIYKNGNISSTMRCQNNGIIIATCSVVGGIIGRSSGGNVTECVNYGDVTLKGDIAHYGVSGIVGMMTASSIDLTVERCVNHGKVSMYIASGNDYKTQQISGIVANAGMDANSGKTAYITNCYNTGDISVFGNSYVQIPCGIVNWGRNYVIENCYNVGEFYNESANSARGIVISYDADYKHDVINCYWLTPSMAAYGNANTNDGATPKSDEEFKNLADSLGENYKNDTKNVNNGYPILSWESN